MIQQSRQMQKDLPLFLQRSPEEAAAGAYRSARDEGRAFAHIEFTYQEFLLHRILLKRLGINSRGLIESSLEIVTTLLDIIAMQTQSAQLVANMSWDVSLLWPPQYCHETFIISSSFSSYAILVFLQQES